MTSSSWQGKAIRGMIRTLSVNCAPILNCSKDDGKTASETASDEMVMGAVQASCESSLLVSKQNHSDLSLTALDDALKQFYKKKGAFQNQKLSKSAKAKVDELLATESHQLRQQKIHRIRAAMDVQVYGAEKVTTSKRRQFQVRLNRAQQAATKWSEADRQRAIERLEREIHQMTRVKRMLLINYSNITSDNHYKKSGLRQPVPEAYSPKNLLKSGLLPKKRFTGRYT